MIKERTIKVKDVLCDICEQSTGYDSETTYTTDRVRHFCDAHKKVEHLFEGMLDLECREAAVAFFNQYVAQYRKEHAR